MEEQRTFIKPRNAEGPDGIKTALRRAMDSKEVGVHRLKAACGVNHQTLANLANGQGGVELRKAQRIAKALDVPLSSLFIHKNDDEIFSE